MTAKRLARWESFKGIFVVQIKREWGGHSYFSRFDPKTKEYEIVGDFHRNHFLGFDDEGEAKAAADAFMAKNSNESALVIPAENVTGIAWCWNGKTFLRNYCRPGHAESLPREIRRRRSWMNSEIRDAERKLERAKKALKDAKANVKAFERVAAEFKGAKR